MLTCVQRLDNEINNSIRRVKKIITGIRSGKYEQVLKQVGTTLECESVKKDYRSIPHLDPTDGLNKFFRDLTKTLEFKNEIETQRITNNTSYFIYLREKMSTHFQFIKEYLGEYVEKYFEDSERDRLIYLLRHKPYTYVSENINDDTSQGIIMQPYTPFDRETASKAIAFSFFKIFQELEMYIQHADLNYTRLLINENPIIINENVSKIRLAYGNYNLDVVKLFYETLAGKYIKDDFKDFCNHFDRTDLSGTKIKWFGSLSLLCTIFSGVRLRDKTNTIVPHLRINNPDIVEMLYDHFEKKTGKEYSKEVIRITLSKLTIKNVGGVSNLLPFLKHIEKGYKTL